MNVIISRNFKNMTGSVCRKERAEYGRVSYIKNKVSHGNCS